MAPQSQFSTFFGRNCLWKLRRFKSNKLRIKEAGKMNIHINLQITKHILFKSSETLLICLDQTKVYFLLKSISFLLCVLSGKTSRNLTNDWEIYEILPCLLNARWLHLDSFLNKSDDENEAIRWAF